MTTSGIIKISAAFLLCAAPAASAQSIWDAEHLDSVRQNIEKPYYAKAWKALKNKADSLLEAAPLSVMMKERTPASGNKHDYMSQARYAWPDPDKADGLPYITRDGISNPEIDKLDRNRLGETASRIKTLSLAYYLSGDEKYAAKATELIRAWFLNKDTRMNPNLEYAQIMPGHNNDKGRSYGLIDTYSFVDMLDGVALLEKSKSFTAKDSRQLKAWFSQLTDWMLKSAQGKEEAAAANNHSVAYDAQIAAFALYSGNRKLAEEVISAVPEKRIFTQIEPDGRQPHELDRTLAFHYSRYNLSHLIDLILMGKKLGLDIDKAVSEDGRNFYKALDYLAGYVGKDSTEWPYRQISGWEGARQELCKDLYRTGRYAAPGKDEYITLYMKNRTLNPEDDFNLIYVDATDEDDAFSFASDQLKYAMQCASEAKKKPENASRRRIMPRSVNPDGSLAMVGAYDWCSGFFPGTLWEMYEYTNDDFWRESAISWTWPVEEAKWHKGTHDLGFMIYDSFGKAYDLTGERSYRDVVERSAKTLISRYNPVTGVIRSWDHNSDVWTYPVIIDNMMNLEMLFRATQITGDSVYWNIAVSHADTTMKNHFRPDFSSYHVVDYDPATCGVRSKVTHQGYADDSFWSRGQSWGVYGYTMCYRFTKDPKYLDQACNIADFFMNLPNMPADGVPYWDMKMPSVSGLTPSDVNPDVPRDASSAAILASALYELSQYVDSDKGEAYRAHADKIVSSLTDSYRAEPMSDYGFLLLHSVGHFPGNSEIDVPLSYADYYYLEALLRKLRLDHTAGLPDTGK